ncbi:MAG: hypothetical protein IJH07_05120 [Ruminococcus sp.]|nr:hypothetical protein [Ruminococcus sp.]
MKKLISLLVTAALLLSLLTVSAFAADPTSGPAQKTSLYGGARCGIYSDTTFNDTYVVNYDYDEGRVVVSNDAIEGMTYDQSTNTLTIDNVQASDDNLFIWYMGNDFKLNVVGDCAFGIINVYDYFAFHNTSLSIIGTGTLTVNENKHNENAIRMFATGSDRLMALDIADSVTVHLYSSLDTETEEENAYCPVVSLSGTGITPAQGGAITIGSKTVPEVKSEQIVVEQADTVNAVIVDNPDKERVRGKQVISKTDPDGVYAVNDEEDGVYYVSRYLYSEELGLWVLDYSFRDSFFSGRRYTKAEFEAEYDYVYGDAPTPIEYTTTWSYENRGIEAVKIVKDGEPDAVYAGTVRWDDDEDDPSGYTIYKVNWSEDEAIYREDTSFTSRFYSKEAMEQEGYHVVTEEVEEKQELRVWDSDDFSDPDGWFSTRYVLKRRSEPGERFAEVGYYSQNDVALGVIMFRVHYDPDEEAYYILGDAYDDDYEYVSESYENLENDTGDFYYDIQTVNKPVSIRFGNRYYSPDSYMSSAYELKKDDEPGAVYAYSRSDHYVSDGEYVTWYTLMKLEYNEQVGCWFEDDSFDEVYGRYDELDDYLEANGFHVVLSEQPLDYLVKGEVNRGEYDVYTDNSGNRYYGTYRKVYRFTDDDIITLGGEQYHYGALEPELNINDLNDTMHEVVTDNYRYWIDGPEYHHIGSEAPVETGFTVSGSITSYIENNNDTTVTLSDLSNHVIGYANGKTSYSIENVPAGEYKLNVDKVNHVSRVYNITVSADTTQDVKICPKGDANMNGSVQANDAMLAYRSSTNTYTFTDDYAKKCADANGNGYVQANDAMMIYRQSTGKHTLF